MYFEGEEKYLLKRVESQFDLKYNLKLKNNNYRNSNLNSLHFRGMLGSTVMYVCTFSCKIVYCYLILVEMSDLFTYLWSF